MALWPAWISKLSNKDQPLCIHKPLVQLASSEQEATRMQTLIQKRQDLGLTPVSAHQAQAAGLQWPKHQWGGIISRLDGWVDPLQLQRNLRSALAGSSQLVTQINDDVACLERSKSKRKGLWQVHQKRGERNCFDVVIICSALGSLGLLNSLGHDRQMEPVLGQVLKLRVPDNQNNWQGWPAVLVYQGINLIPYGSDQLLMGATVEPGEQADPNPLALMQQRSGELPDWLQAAKIINQWHGLRAKPVHRSAPILEVLEPGLILATAHYRNGVLLTPASAEWIAKTLEHKQELTCS